MSRAVITGTTGQAGLYRATPQKAPCTAKPVVSARVMRFQKFISILDEANQ